MLLDLKRPAFLKRRDDLYEALADTHPAIDFSPDGMIINANRKFLDVMGYRLEDIVGKHHRLFMDPEEAKSPAYEAFWQALRSGRCQSATFKRIAKDGRMVWLQATYLPMRDSLGKVSHILKFATDESANHAIDLETRGKMAALNKAQAVIEFNLDGTIVTANENFSNTMGYSLEEIRGQHHRMFVTPEDAASPEYEMFWEKLRSGEALSAQYRRVAKGGQEVWLNASYNPILDDDGNPIKIVKFATDITERKLRNADHEGKIMALNKAQAVIEFNTDGTILTANENFLNTVGYSLEEIQGKHHRMFVDRDERESPEYQKFWENLARGKFEAGEYQRIGKGGQKIWLQATYNPILGPAGDTLKVVKFASDTTEAVIKRQERDAFTTDIFRNLDKVLDSIRQAHGRSETATSSANETDSMVQTVAAASEELNTSFQDIASSVSYARQATDKAAKDTEAANESTRQLTKAAHSMELIITLIEEIAGQINLLALNATIESARAGEAGRGFAVVASEVKNLATQVSSATNRVSGEINAMQSISSEVAGRLTAITEGVHNLQGNVNGIASAVEQQTAVTREISSNMQSAAGAVANITGNLTDLSTDISATHRFTEDAADLIKKIR